MFVILMYDVNAKRTNKMLKIGRKYLRWIQNSILEGEINEANYFKMVKEINKVVNREEDSVIIYQFRSMNYSKRENIGIKKGGDELFI